MSRSTSPRRAPAPRPTTVPATKTPDGNRRESARETVEAIVGAILLAILIRGFEAEAFVIPTGSMAPTLMGRHKEIECPQCGFVYAVNASDEVEGTRSGSPIALRVASGTCGNCRFQADLSQEPSFKGDRILVDKSVYDMPYLPGASEPERWDVVVFRFPEEPETNYIKRLIGLPGESVRIWYGDAYIKAPKGQSFEIARKPLEHQAAMQIMVYDDHLRPIALKDQEAWKRWVPGKVEAWSEDATNPGRFKPVVSPTEWSEFHYEHKVPDPGQWRAIVAGESLPRTPRATLITDFSAYNTNLSASNADLSGDVSYEQENAWFQPHWVGDLTLSCRLDVEKAEGKVRFELVEGGVLNRAEFDLASGKVAVTRDGKTVGDAGTSINQPGVHDVRFANVDNRLTLWIDGQTPFGAGLSYEDDPENHPAPTVDDLKPARISAFGASVAVSDLVLTRDIYYTVKPGTSDYGNPGHPGVPRNPLELFDFLADPAKVAALGPLMQGEVYKIGEDRFMMFGDNSPRSKDGRDWHETDRLYPPNAQVGDEESSGWDASDRRSWEVPRNLITGKAFAVFWPHGKPFWPNLKLTNDFRVPFRPYFERMKWIR